MLNFSYRPQVFQCHLQRREERGGVTELRRMGRDVALVAVFLPPHFGREECC